MREWIKCTADRLITRYGEKTVLNRITIIGVICIWLESFVLGIMSHSWFYSAFLATIMIVLVFVLILPIHLAVRHRL